MQEEAALYEYSPDGKDAASCERRAALPAEQWGAGAVRNAERKGDEESGKEVHAGKAGAGAGEEERGGARSEGNNCAGANGPDAIGERKIRLVKDIDADIDDLVEANDAHIHEQGASERERART